MIGQYSTSLNNINTMNLHLPNLTLFLQPKIVSLMMMSLASLLLGCSPSSDSVLNAPIQEASQEEFLSPSHRNAWHDNFSTAGSQLASQLHHNAEQLHLSIQTFLHQPNEENRLLAQQNWLTTYDKFQAMEPAQHYLKSIAPPNQLQQISLMDQWPIIPGYIDSVAGHPFSGIVNDVTVTLDLKTVIAQHSPTDASEASLGLHVLEYFLWGESQDQLKPLQHYSPLKNWPAPQQQRPISDHPNNRRRTYLLLLSELIRSTCYQANSLWALPDNTRYSSLALESLYTTLGEIRKDLHQPSSPEDKTFSGHAHRPLTPRIQALLYFLPSAKNPPTNAMIKSTPNPTPELSANNQFTQQSIDLSHKINAIINNSKYTLDDKNWSDKLDFALTQLETTLFNAMGSPANLNQQPSSPSHSAAKP